MAITKEQLLARKFGHQELEIPDLGTIVFRPLTRAEALSVNDREMTMAEAEQALLSLAMVDPKMTADDVKKWQEIAPAGELQPLVDAITKASGMVVESAKEAVKQFRS